MWRSHGQEIAVSGAQQAVIREAADKKVRSLLTRMENKTANTQQKSASTHKTGQTAKEFPPAPKAPRPCNTVLLLTDNAFTGGLPAVADVQALGQYRVTKDKMSSAAKELAMYLKRCPLAKHVMVAMEGRGGRGGREAAYELLADLKEECAKKQIDVAFIVPKDPSEAAWPSYMEVALKEFQASQVKKEDISEYFRDQLYKMGILEQEDKDVTDDNIMETGTVQETPNDGEPPVKRDKPTSSGKKTGQNNSSRQRNKSIDKNDKNSKKRN